MIQYLKINEYTICIFNSSIDRFKYNVVFKYNLVYQCDLVNGFNVDIVLCASDVLNEIFEYIFNNVYYS